MKAAVMGPLAPTGKKRPAGIVKAFTLQVDLPTRRLLDDVGEIKLFWTLHLQARDRAHALQQAEEWLLRAFYKRTGAWERTPETDEIWWCDVEVDQEAAHAVS